ncbi:MAG: hypothetical protein K2F77_04250 [Muribaculaceae bacterium]|nr:hypothetical protein [Muribaculaceae bacterium]
MKQQFARLVQWLKGLSFRTGIIAAGCCLLCYAISFTQMLLPISAAAKAALWAAFFGMAKALQYTALLILGKAGLTRLRTALRR